MKNCKYMEELFSVSDNDDIAIEILSRLPVKSLVAFKCTSKRWYSFVSDPSFLRIHSQRSKEITRLFVQNMVRLPNLVPRYDSIDLLTPTRTGFELNYKSLDFLPEKVIVLSSSNGILCCRNWVNPDYRRCQKKSVTYICNPITRQWIQFTSKIDDKRNHYIHNLIPGFAFYPFGSSSGAAASVFKLVKIFYDYECHGYSFEIYSSDTNKLKRSKVFCKTLDSLCGIRCSNYPPRVVFVNGWLHWWTNEYSIIAFHVEKDSAKRIKLPRAPPYTFGLYKQGIICWGESEGYFHYVYALGLQLQVWVLKNYVEEEEEEEEKPAWELKYCLDMVPFAIQHISLRKTIVKGWLEVTTFHEDVLYMRNCVGVGSLLSYNFRTKTFKDHGEVVRQSNKDPHSTMVSPFAAAELYPIVVPFSASLLPLHVVGHQSNWNRKRKRLEVENRDEHKARSDVSGVAAQLTGVRSSTSYTSMEGAIGALQAIPDIDDDLLLDGCDLLEDEKKAKIFLALDATLRKKWLLRKLGRQ